MQLPFLVQALLFGVAVAVMVIGLVGTVVPILPGIILVWLTVLAYAILEGFKAIDWLAFLAISLIALVAGTSDLWLSLLGAKGGGAAGRSILLGAIGSILGFFLLGALIPIVGSLFGGLIGYALGIFLGQYHKYRDWRVALKASLGGVAGWGVATAIQAGASLIIILIFVWQVLSY